MNLVVLSGRAATDCDTREITGGSTVASTILAVERNSEECDFFRIKLWNQLAEEAAEKICKGRQLMVEGALRQDVYTGVDGEERRGVAVIAKRIEYL